MTATDVIQRFENVRKTGRGWSARCPNHDDRANSLNIAVGRGGRTLLHCFAGCDTEAIAHAVGLSLADLFAEPVTSAKTGTRERPVSQYDQVRHDLLARERRLAERRWKWAEVTALADEARAVDRLVTEARALVSALGDTNDQAWELAGQAARLETMMRAAEADAHEAVAGRALW